MRDIGIRIQRYRLSRYRPPDAIGERARFWLALGLGGWLVWALFLSDHSAIRLAGLEHKRGSTEQNLAKTNAVVKGLEKDLKSANDPDVGERVLRERHNFARDGERLYVIQGDGSVRTASPADSIR